MLDRYLYLSMSSLNKHEDRFAFTFCSYSQLIIGVVFFIIAQLPVIYTVLNQLKLRGFSPPANYTDRETVACRRS
jgi:hypothetical protein